MFLPTLLSLLLVLYYLVGFSLILLLVLLLLILLWLLWVWYWACLFLAANNPKITSSFSKGLYTYYFCLYIVFYFNFDNYSSNYNIWIWFDYFMGLVLVLVLILLARVLTFVWSDSNKFNDFLFIVLFAVFLWIYCPDFTLLLLLVLEVDICV